MAASQKELDRRIRTVKNTQQITRAMKMVAAAKLRRAQDRLVAARPYAAKLDQLLAGLAGTNIEHPFFEQRELKKRLVVVVSSDKGLCGSYNANITREAELWLKAQGDVVENTLYVVGRKANEYFKRRRWPIDKAITDLNGTIDLDRFNVIADELMHRFVEDEFQEIVIFTTKFVSTLSYKPTHYTLLPLKPDEAADDEEVTSSSNYLYEPSPEAVLTALLPKSVRNRVFNALAEAFTSEHGARMTSMGSATDNAGELIDTLTLFRNRARQAAITQEISEIVGGANALA